MIRVNKQKISANDLVIVSSADYNARNNLTVYLRDWCTAQPDLNSVRIISMDHNYEDKNTYINIFTTSSVDELFEKVVLKGDSGG